MRILFEGTEEQVKNLMLLIEHGDNDLPKLKTNYQLYNLWSIEDVQPHYDCDEDTAMSILEEALTNESVMAAIWNTIDMCADEEGLKEINR